MKGSRIVPVTIGQGPGYRRPGGGCDYIPRLLNRNFEESMEHQDRYVPANINGGWPFAGGIILLALICIGFATYVHKKTYRDPTDPTWHAKGQRPAATTGH